VQTEELVSKPLVVEVYYDYLCPYVYAGALWARDVKTALGDDIEFAWRSFPLEQVNSAEGPEWKLWEQDNNYVSRGFNAFRGAEAAKLQGPDQFINYHYAILESRHVEDQNIGRKEVVIEAARSAGLDVDAFEAALADRALLANIGKDYEHARNVHGVFGTPTFVFPGGEAAYIKMRPKAPDEDAVAVWNDFVETVVGRPYVHEIKRPTKPE
jgi:predicted DsbA family dithiol-disulfide isomerase